MRKSICFQCNEEDIILEKEGVCSHCDSLNRKNDYLSGEFNGDLEITKKNIHLYYEFMNDEDLEKHKEILTEIFRNRYAQVFENVNLHVSHLIFKTIQKYYYVGQTIFGVKDILRPIKEFISAIKENEEYITYMQNKENKTK